MSEHADSFPPFVVVVPNTPRRPVEQESLRSWLRRQVSIYGWRTRLLFVLAMAMVALFGQVAAVWQPTVIATAPENITLASAAAESSTAAIPADERSLAIWTGQAISIHDRSSRRVASSIPYPWKMEALSFSQDGRSLLTQDQPRHLRLFDVSTGALRFELPDGAWPDIRSACLSPDGSRLAIYNPSFRGALWDCTNHRKLMSDPQGFMGGSMAFTPDGRYFVAIAFDGGLSVRRWNAIDGTVASNVLLPHAEEPGKYPEFDGNSAKFSPDGSVVAYIEYISRNAFQVHVIDARTGAERVKPAQIAVDGQGPMSQFTPDSKLLCVFTLHESNNGTNKQGWAIDSIDLATGRVASRPPEAISPIFTDSPDGRLVACMETVPRHLLILDSRTLQTVADLPGQFSPDNSPFSPDGRRLVVQQADTGEYGIYDTLTWKRISALPADKAYDPILLADGSILSVQSNNCLVSWTQHRPDAWWGAAVLWQFWVAFAAVALFVWSISRDIARHGRLAQ